MRVVLAQLAVLVIILAAVALILSSMQPAHAGEWMGWQTWCHHHHHHRQVMCR
jgi:hypothetical protein